MRLIKIVEELQEVQQQGGGDVARFAASSMAGRGASMEAVAAPLAFIKAIAKVLSLDVTISAEVAALRRTLLTQIGVREFNSESEYSDPSVSYVLTDVVCAYCNTSRDLDMLRDPSVGSSVDQFLSEGNKSALHCPSCRNAYDRDVLEKRLMEDAEKANAQYTLQDFRCAKTHTVSTRLCATTSVYCAPLVMDISASSLQEKLAVLKRVAKFHRFEWLEEIVSSLLNE